MSEQAIIQDLQKSLQDMTADRDRWRDIAYSLAAYEANANGSDIETVIQDEQHWLERQAQWNTIEDIK